MNKIIPFEGNAKKKQENEEKHRKKVQRIIPIQGKAKKEEEKEQKQGKKVQRIIPFERKAKKEEKKETLATLFGERMLSSMPGNEVGVPPAILATPRLSANGPTGGFFAHSSGERAPRRHGATTVFFNTTIPRTIMKKRCCGWWHTYIDSEKACRGWWHT